MHHIQSNLPRFTFTLLGALLLGFQSNVYAEINLNDNLLQNKGIQLQLITEVYEDNLDGDINLAFNLATIDDNVLTSKLNDALGLNSLAIAQLKAAGYNSEYFNSNNKFNSDDNRWLLSNSVAIIVDDDL